MEIGSFIEMEFPRQNEYYSGPGIARLNSGRAGIFHAARVLECSTVFLPFYQCDTVRDFLVRKEIGVRYYSIDEKFNPLIQKIPTDSAIVIANYFGIMGQSRLENLSSRYKNVIIDNSQAFFSKPLSDCISVYSARKFIGVPDGAYVIGTGTVTQLEEYEQDISSDTSLFLLQRIEYGCAGKSYEAKLLNEQRINNSDIKKMSKLTRAILDGTNYDLIKKKRRENFDIACNLFGGINKINPRMYYDEDCIPMVYPLVVENDDLLAKLLANKIYQGHWWSYLLESLPEDSYEYWLSKYIIPVTIDQRYDKAELDFTAKIIYEFLDGIK
ncbi:hypothetical protein [Sporomusa acidovorans]|uniref:DegT/DnrJ/EryC1/StrS aminotransferase family protein n=1 Tax=Sporomusa acidovorans (strain ATCC 49682 / DSM 3132 / Mol) TaxID=1123286 RepID=A0ABZ3IZA2_SPOA4|nr:hypothetical protein [Sporomusa acidovorans]OZC17238.1 hypothetical protein SPACI_38880 [Sporomusa acidovorans DSM 3132]SDF15410.1 hypothetical protein SAMN04488499_103521 [Sporomusa acidovorans]